jgi:hypothetical protein
LCLHLFRAQRRGADMGVGICVCCMKLTKRSVQLAFDPAHRVFPGRTSQNSSPARAEERAFSNMKARSHARYQLYRKASLGEWKCVFLEKAGRNGRVSVDTRYGRDWGKIHSMRSWSSRLGFLPTSFFALGRHLHVVSVLLLAFGHGVSRSWILS